MTEEKKNQPPEYVVAKVNPDGTLCPLGTQTAPNQEAAVKALTGTLTPDAREGRFAAFLLRGYKEFALGTQQVVETRVEEAPPSFLSGDMTAGPVAVPAAAVAADDGDD